MVHLCSVTLKCVRCCFFPQHFLANVFSWDFFVLGVLFSVICDTAEVCVSTTKHHDLGYLSKDDDYT